jgi:hypothetical protein
MVPRTKSEAHSTLSRREGLLPITVSIEEQVQVFPNRKLSQLFFRVYNNWRQKGRGTSVVLFLLGIIARNMPTLLFEKSGHREGPPRGMP